MKPDKLDCGHPIDLTFSSTRHIQVRYSNSYGGIMISRAVISEVLVTEPNDEDQELVVTFKLVGEPEWANR